MDVAVIGTGNIGRALGTAFARGGHAVTFGVRDPAPSPDIPDFPRVDVGTALGRAEVVVLAVPAGAVSELVAEHTAALADHLVIDATNNIGGAGPVNSAAVIGTLPGARYARAFNTLGVENLREPTFGGVPADMVFSCAEPDRDTVAALISAVGLRPVWVGDGAADVVDGVLRLWFALARLHGRHLAFRVLTDTGEV